MITRYTLHSYSHIEFSCCRARKVLGFVKWIAFEFNLECSINVLYCSIVRSIVEYFSVSWDLHITSSSLQLERVQRRFLSFSAYVLNIGHAPHDYFPVLCELQITSLADRRATANLSLLHLSFLLLDGSTDALLSSISLKYHSVPSALIQPSQFQIVPQTTAVIYLYIVWCA